MKKDIHRLSKLVHERTPIYRSEREDREVEYERVECEKVEDEGEGVRR